MDICNCYDNLLVVMGGGIQENGELPQMVIPRCKAVLSHPKISERTLVICSSSFTLNCPPKLTSRGFPLSEASAMYIWLKKNGFRGPMVCEQQSHDTVGSIFFILSLYASSLGVNSVEFITSEFHARRARKIAYSLNDKIFSSRFEININSVVNLGVTKKRILHERESLKRFNKMFGDVSNASQFIERFVTHHSNYNHTFGSDVLAGQELNY